MVSALGRLEDQGDGMVSYASLVLRAYAEVRSIQLINEPEAFLHPPQARLAAEIITSADVNRQTFIATHSGDIVRGLLSTNSKKVSFIRLQRGMVKTKASYLPTEKVAELWSDPILRYSNILEGIFHEGVVLAEGDADCKFFEAIGNVIDNGEDRIDLFYTYSGGKHRMPVVAKALKALSVPLRIICDFDLLNNDEPLRSIIGAVGGDWSTVSDDWTQIKQVVESSKSYLNSDRFKREVADYINSVGGNGPVSKDIILRIRNACTHASPWAEAKKRGLAGLPAGDTTTRAKRLLTRLKEIGIFVIPEGEMEGFCRSVGGKGPRWVEEVLKRDLPTDPELQIAINFVREFRASIQAEVI
jgi:hypothetical protein